MRGRLAALVAAALLVPGSAVHAEPPPGEADDTHPPVIAFGIDPGGWQGWFPRSMELRLFVTDPDFPNEKVSGVGLVEWEMSGATTASGGGGSKPLSISNEGSTMVTVRAWDKADNGPTVAQYAVGVDRGKPEVGLGAGIFNGAVFDRDQVVMLGQTCSDRYTGIALCEAAVGGTVIGPAGRLPTGTVGSYQLNLTARDHVGNTYTETIRYSVRAPAPVFTIDREPTLTGTPRVDEVLELSHGTITPAPAGLEYVWWVDGDTPVPGAKGRTLRVTPDLVGKPLSASVIASGPGVEPVRFTSPTTARVEPGSFSVPQLPAPAGEPRFGQVLTAPAAGFTPQPHQVTYQWLADGAVLPGATGATFSPGGAQLGKRLTVRLEARRDGYTTASAVSGATAAVQPGSLTATAIPSVTGEARVGQLLTAAPGSFAPQPQQVGYQWLADGVAVPGATSALYRLGAADVGRRLSVRVEAHREHHQPATALSAATAPVAKLASTVAVKVKAKAKKRKATLRITVSVPGGEPSGTVTVTRGKRIVAKDVVLANGRVKVKAKRLRRGRLPFVVAYSGSATVLGATTTTARVRIARVFLL